MRLHKSHVPVKVNISDRAFTGVMILMLVLVFLRTFWEWPIPAGVLLAISLIPALFGTPNQIIAFAVSCIPLSGAFQFKYALLLCMVCYMIRKSRRFKFTQVALMILLLMIWELFHAYYGSFSFVEYLRGFAELLFLIVIVDIDVKNLDYRMIARTLAYCTLGVCVIIFLLQLKNAGWSFGAIVFTSRFGATNTSLEQFSLSFNPNRLGYICNLSISALLLIYNERKHSWVDIVSIALLAGFGMLTQSRTFLICFIIVICGFFLTMRGTVKQKLFAVLALCAVIVGVLLLINFLMPTVYDLLVSRFLESDLSNGRTTLFAFYNKHILSAPALMLFGVGLQDYSDKIGLLYDVEIAVCHNGIQEILVVWGLVGLLLFAYMLIVLFRAARRYSPRQRAVQYIPLVLLLASVMAGQWISAEIPLLSLTFIYVCLSHTQALHTERNQWIING